MMDEKVVKLVVGCFTEGVEGLPFGYPDHPQGWEGWLEGLPGITRGPRFEGIQLVAAYQSRPVWVGLLVGELDHLGAWSVLEPPEGWTEATLAWESLRDIVRAYREVELPEGNLIVAHDE